MKVGFTGSQGTGKTSLANAMIEDPNFKDFIFVPSAARDALEAGFKINKEASRTDQVVTTMARFTKEADAMKNENVIADRMLADSHAYTIYQKECVWIASSGDEYLLEVSRRLALISASNYDKIFFFPPYWAPVNDAVRSLDAAYQLSVSDIIEEFLFKNDIPFQIVPQCSVKDRLEWITKQIY